MTSDAPSPDDARRAVADLSADVEPPSAGCEEADILYDYIYATEPLLLNEKCRLCRRAPSSETHRLRIKRGRQRLWVCEDCVNAILVAIGPMGRHWEPD